VKDARSVRWIKEHNVELDAVQPIDPTRYDGKIESRSAEHLFEDGGLHIIGSERHESRRIDRQLRGRAGRQGDPGATQFFLSLEDDLMRLFGGMDRIAQAMEKMGAEEGEVITHTLVTKSIERAQKRVEENNFEARKRLLDYDDVMNQQREVVYDMRLFALEGGEDLKGELWEMIELSLEKLVEEYASPSADPEDWELGGLKRRLLMDFMVPVEGLPDDDGADHEFNHEDVLDLCLEAARAQFHRKIETWGELAGRVMSFLLLSTIDSKWKDHLYDLDHLKASIGFRGWGQKDPLVEYKKEAFEMFVDFMNDLRGTITQNFFRAQVTAQPQVPQPAQRMTLSGPSEAQAAAGVAGARAAAPVGGGGAASAQPRVDATGIAVRARVEAAGVPAGMPSGLGTPTDVSQLSTNRDASAAGGAQPARASDEPGRNDPCPCGSGKKYKKCHGRAG